MADRTSTWHEPADTAEQAAIDAWNRGSADTTGMLYAVRHALAAERRAVGPTLAEDAPERLARHLYLLSAKTDQWRRIFTETWDQGEIDRTPWLGQADAILAIATGKED